MVAGSMASLFKPKKWKWLARKSLQFLDGFTKEYGIELSSLMGSSGPVYDVELAVSIRDQFSGQISCSKTVAANIFQQLAVVVSTTEDPLSVTPMDPAGSESSVVSVSYAPTESE